MQPNPAQPSPPTPPAPGPQPQYYLLRPPPPKPIPGGLIVALVVVLVLALVGVAFLGYSLMSGPTDGGGAQVTNVTVSGVVTAGQNAGVPVPDAVVHIALVSGTGSGGSLNLVTDAAGVYTFVARAGSTYSLYATLGIHWGTATGSTVTRTILGTTSTTTLDLTVPASDIYGTVTNATSGLPIGGAIMSLSDPSGSPWCCLVVNASGTYLLWGISAGTYTVSASAVGYVSAYATALVPSMYSSSLADFHLTSAPGGAAPYSNVTVTGLVTAGQNASVPVPNAVVHVAVNSGSSSGVPSQIQTDGNGSYAFVGSAGSTYSLYATLGIAFGTATGSTTTLTVSGTTPVVEVNLTVPASDIYGTVTNASTGAPIGGATIGLTPPSGPLWCCMTTGANGEYLLWEISTGSYTVSVQATGYAAASATVDVAALYTSHRVDFSLVP